MLITDQPNTPARPQAIDDSKWIVLTWVGVCVGIIFRVVHIGKQSVWFDEGYSAWMISHRFGEIVRLIKSDTSPPLFYLLLRAWSLVFGRSEIALRSFSALFSVATLLLIVEFARRVLRNWPAVAMATWIAALSFMLNEYAQEARCYALLAFLCLGAIYCLHRHLSAGGWVWICLIALCLSAALYIHNMAACYVVAIAPVWLILPSKHSFGRRIRDGLLTAAIIAAAYLPWAAVVLHGQMKMVQQSFWVTPPTAQNVKWVMAGLAGIRHYWHIDAKMPFIPFAVLDVAETLGNVIVCLSVVIAILTQPGPQRRNAIALAIFALGPPFAIAIYSCWFTPLLIDKVFLTTSTIIPVLIMIPATGGAISRPVSRFTKFIASESYDAVFSRRAGYVLGWMALILVGWSTWGHSIEVIKEDWRSAAREIGSYPPGRRLIVCIANDGQLPLDYYYKIRPEEEITGAPAGFFDRDPPQTMLRVLRPNDLDALHEKLINGNYQDVVLVLSHTGWADPENRAYAMLKQMYFGWEISRYWDVEVVRFRFRVSGK